MCDDAMMSMLTSELIKFVVHMCGGGLLLLLLDVATTTDNNRSS